MYVTDARLGNFKGLNQLKELGLYGDITDEGLEKLRRALPNCRIKREELVIPEM